MTQFEKINFKIQTVAILVSGIFSGFMAYTSSSNGVTKGFDEMKNEIKDFRYDVNMKLKDLENEEKNCKEERTELKERTKILEASVFTYIGKSPESNKN